MYTHNTDKDNITESNCCKQTAFQLHTSFNPHNPRSLDMVKEHPSGFSVLKQ